MYTDGFESNGQLQTIARTKIMGLIDLELAVFPILIRRLKFISMQINMIWWFHW